MIRITELARKTGASVDELHYLERKGFVRPVRARLRRRQVRQYQDADVRKLQLTIKYRREGFTWDVAFQKALQELQNPRLFDEARLFDDSQAYQDRQRTEEQGNRR